MSKQYVTDLIRMIREHPDLWCPMADRKYVTSGSQGKLNDGIALGLGRVRLYWHLNPVVNGVEAPLGFWDSFRLRRAMRWWYRAAPLTAFETVHIPD